MRSGRKLTCLLLTAAAAVLMTGCATTVNKIIADPSHYRNREARLSGQVVDSYSVGGRGAYRLDDRTGQIWIVSDRGVPRRGAWVKVRGTVREGFNLGMLGDRIKLPVGIDTGLVLIESSHKAK
jgi:uncharacterized protein YceK